MSRPFQYSRSVESEPARAARQMPMRPEGSEAKSTPSASTATRAYWLCQSSRAKRFPRDAAVNSASVTRLVAFTMRLSIAEDQCAIDAAETGVDFDNVLQRRPATRFKYQAG